VKKLLQAQIEMLRGLRGGSLTVRKGVNTQSTFSTTVRLLHGCLLIQAANASRRIFRLFGTARSAASLPSISSET
jgi:hypothetical protein